ncbi:uncharacterized protein CcaverHIS019_0111480 [Cutaneotrichosporon cavernicola]|uniref:Nucleolar GTP-binding protein 2 n=1 Tax=Cutaneotrichosporon cavernicola TaxID=279322 RepID=A0AA48L0M8_9TREE|nr:uncharacterized protein CcaverHIS019_0111480 [Cutaneotrichosporon cavernicola]BEI88430.1 hypothetical protein CcaverHIS019_0111480 [Cutaneotrichosporon cavernicola]BEI96203.1 hypothetical protein CcaverHIS631_0111520 [Cutaneotrichosporon cavernicola]BEJ03974.1 hypothetical protein CcaverHIS641_0111490 [Cutaneotrichosporon cavernicola]
MGKGKNTVRKEGHGRVKGKSASGSKLVGEFATGVTRVKGENFYRDAKSASRVKMLNGGKAVRDRDGKIVKAAAFQSKEAEPGRVQPDKRWFGNTRVISQDALDHFRTALANHKKDPLSVLLKRNRLPMGLIQDESKNATGKRPHIVDTEPFSDTFGPKSQRKRPRLNTGSFAELGEATAAIDDAEDEAAAMMTLEEAQAVKEAAREAAYGSARSLASAPIYQKGTSRRIWGELYKVLDSSDVVIHVLDARDPMGSRCKPVVEYLKKEKSHKTLIYVLNKCDLVPGWVTARWKSVLQLSAPTIAFHAAINNSFGKGALIQLLRQFSVLHSDKKQISVGFIGYPNVGKSSIINTLKKKKVCTVAPIPGETKVWQYITLMRRIYLIDCPGVVPLSAKDSESDTVLKGVVRVENLDTPAEHIPELLNRVRKEYLERTYGLEPRPDGWHGEEGATILLSSIAKKSGKLLKGGEPDLESAAKMVLNDWIRGKIPFFVPPPSKASDSEIAAEGVVTEVSGEAAKIMEEHERALGKLLGEKKVKGVEQSLKSIITMPKFMGDDSKRPAGMESDQEMADAESDEGAAAVEDEIDEDMDDDEEEEEDDEDEDVEEEDGDADLAWEDVFPDDADAPPKKKTKRAAEAEVAAEDDEDEDAPSKEKRMTTNKTKATNFYTFANVKNRNRDRKTPKNPSVRERGRDKKKVARK